MLVCVFVVVCFVCIFGCFFVVGCWCLEFGCEVEVVVFGWGGGVIGLL